MGHLLQIYLFFNCFVDYKHQEEGSLFQLFLCLSANHLKFLVVLMRKVVDAVALKSPIGTRKGTPTDSDKATNKKILANKIKNKLAE